jgi:general secretion pathway protein D
VLVDDGQIVVIGGLIQDGVRETVEKVPFLGDIPLLGTLFTYSTRSRSKTNLMVFLRPTVLRNPQRAESLTTERYDYILGEQHKAQPPASWPLPDLQAPKLPPRPPPAPAPVAAPPAAFPSQPNN